MHRDARSLSLLAAGLLLAVASPVAAEIRDAEFSFDPAVPTWHEPVTVEIRGESECFVSLFALVRSFELGTGPVIAIELDQLCILAPPQFIPFQVTAELGRLDPGDYTVRITPPGGGAAVAEVAFRVYEPADLEIAPPAELPTDAAPFTFTVTGITTTCLGPEPPVVEGNAISVVFPEGCPFLPPEGGILTFAYTAGPLPAGDYQIRAFRASRPGQVVVRPLRVFAAEGCLPADTVLCLGDARFRVAASWKDFTGGSGDGHAVPLTDRDDTGLFWFFDASNVELTVKVLNGCAVNGRYWVFIAPGSTVEYTITVTDTRADETRTYRNDLGATPSLIPDTAAFATCP
jgi:hypothetical protein